MGMNDLFPFLFIGGIIIVVLFSIVAHTIAEKKRRQALEKVAHDLGLDFLAEGNSELLLELADFHLFSKGRSKRMSNMICGDTDDVAISVFDFQFTTGGGKSSQTHRQTVAFFRAYAMPLPRFTMRPQSMFHSIGKMFGTEDIDFKSHELFSKSFILQGGDAKQIRKLFSPDLLSYLEHKPGVCIEADGDHLVFYRPAVRSKPGQYRELMKEGFELFNKFRKQVSELNDGSSDNFI